MLIKHLARSAKHDREQMDREGWPLKPGAAQRMAFDALLAVRSSRWGTTVVTDNWDDFKAIQRYCNLKLIKGSDFFK